MLIVTGTIRLEPGAAEKAKAAAVAVGKATRAEPGCHTYAFWQSLEDENLFRVYEEWEDRDALKAHFEMPHMAVFRAALGEIGVISREIVSFDQGEVVPL